MRFQTAGPLFKRQIVAAAGGVLQNNIAFIADFLMNVLKNLGVSGVDAVFISGMDMYNRRSLIEAIVS